MMGFLAAAYHRNFACWTESLTSFIV